MRILTRRESHDGVERFHIARAAPGVGPMYWTSLYRTGGVLVDAGHVHAREEVKRFVAERPVEAALATHEHEDHVGNFRALAERGVATYAPKAAVDLLARVARGERGRLPLYRALVWGNHDGASGVRVAAGTVKAGGSSFRLVPTPGHSAEHVALLDEASSALYTGDAVLGKLKMCRRVEDIPTQMDSLRRILALDPRVVYPAHGPILDRPREQVGAVLAYFEDLSRRAHRRASEGRSLAAITRELLGRESAMTWFSGWEFSKRNLVASLLSRPPA